MRGWGGGGDPRRGRGEGIIGCTEGEVMAASEAAYYVSVHIHPLQGSRLSVLLLSGTASLCDAAGTLGARSGAERRTDARVLLSKSVGAVSFNR